VIFLYLHDVYFVFRQRFTSNSGNFLEDECTT
jgi:hypothetical protein